VKTEQERIDYLANRVREFNIQVSGGGLIDGGFGKLPPIGQGDITIEHLEQAFSEFRLTGNNGIQAHGSLEHGYLLFGNPPTAGPEGFAPVVPLPPIPPILTGACCAEDGSCTITTSADCTGTYQGDGTPCDPNPCPPPLPDCMCGFDAFDGSGRRFLHKESTCTYNTRDDYSAICGSPGVHTRYDDKTFTPTSSYTADYDPDTCAFSSSNGHYTFHEVFTSCVGLVTTFDTSGTFGDSSCIGCGTTFGCSESIVTTATTRTTTDTFAGGGGFPITTGSGTFTETLSDECIPI
jgi:hypothetical protein